MRITTLVRQALVLLVASLATIFLPAQSLPSASAQIQDFGLVSSSSGWLLAANHLYWTSSLGASWAEITPPSATAISAAAFRADGSGWALTSASGTLAIARTADNGQHWSTAAIAPAFTDAERFNGHASLSFADARNGFLMLDLQSGSAFKLGLLMHTTDGGATWQPVATPPIGGDISFISSTRGFNGPGAQGDELYLTTDAATTWQRVTLSVPTALANFNSTIELPTFTDATHGSLLRTFATDTTPTTVRYNTSDAGLTWSIADTTVSPRFKADATTLSRFPTNAGTFIANKSSLFGSNGLVLFTAGNCTNGTCSQTSALLSTTNGGATFNQLGKASGFAPESTRTFALPTGDNIPVTLSAPGSVHPDSSVVYSTAGVMGFDACSLPSTAALTDWYANSPYRVFGAYFGGVNFGCTVSTSLTASYITTVTNQGWQVIPIWVGLQGVGGCGGSCSSMSSDPTTAQAQGVTEADNALAQMTPRGIRQGSTIMYDMEAYSHTVAANAAATRAFIQGWTTELHAKGYLSAMYSSHPEFTDWYPNVVNPDLDIVWFAYFFNSGVACGTECQTVFPTQSSFDISTSYWLNNHRARQTSSGFNSTYGSTKLNIDEDWVDAPMDTATPNTLSVNVIGPTGSVASSTITNTNGDQTAFTAITCGGSCNAPAAPTDTIALNPTIPSGQSVSWNNCTTVSSNICSVLVSKSLTVTASFGYPLTVSSTGSGTGTITSGDGFINCGATCSFAYPTTDGITLTAAATIGSYFTGWTGCTTSTGTTCQVTIGTAASSVVATFVPGDTLTVTKSGSGTGTVTSADTKINCGSTCSSTYAPSTVVVLTAAPASGSTFTGWSGGGCTGTSTCSTTLTAATTVNAGFDTPLTLTVAKSGTGTGTVTSADTNINCGATCSAAYTSGTTIVLTATATATSGSVFTGWSGGGCSGTGTCSLTITMATTVTANFVTPTYTATAATPSLTIARGGSGTAVLNFALANGWTGSFSNFTCSVAGITCSASNVTASSGTSATASVTIAASSTFSQSMVPANLPHPNRTLPIAFAMLTFPALLLPFTLRKRRHFRAINLALTFIAVLGFSQLLTGCGGNSASAAPAPTSRTVSVPITYTATTGGTAAAGTPVTVSVTVTF